MRKQQTCKRGHQKTQENILRSFNGRTWYAKCRVCHNWRKKTASAGNGRRIPLTVNQKRSRAADQRRYRKVNPEKVRESKRRYLRSAKGIASSRRSSSKYWSSAKGVRCRQRTYERAKADPVRWRRVLELSRQWSLRHPDLVKENHQQWLNTPNGRRYQRRNSLGLPSNAPDELCVSSELLKTLNKEMKREYKRA